MAARLTEDDRAALTAAIRGEIRFDEPMARHTTLRLGGPVDAYVEPADIADAQALARLCSARGLAWRPLGAGSNLLVRDGGLRGVGVSTRALRGLRREGDGDSAVVVVEAGVATGKLLAMATAWELGGVEFLGGVPGSVGGGIWMNAGTYLGEFKDVLTEVASVTPAGELRRRAHAECGFAYRHSELPPDELIVEGTLRLRPRPRADIDAEVRSLRDRRRAREPHGVANAGSIFKNPPGDFAGRLIEAAGLKGLTIGGCQVSPAHANWLVNTGNGRADELLELIARVHDEVLAKFGVDLQLEVKVVGEA